MEENNSTIVNTEHVNTEHVNTEHSEMQTNSVDKKSLALGKSNFILMAVSMIIVIVGFVLMSGSASDDTTFDADIFSTMRIKVAPVVCFVGFVSMIYAIVHKPNDNKEA